MADPNVNDSEYQEYLEYLEYLKSQEGEPTPTPVSTTTPAAEVPSFMGNLGKGIRTAANVFASPVEAMARGANILQPIPMQDLVSEPPTWPQIGEKALRTLPGLAANIGAAVATSGASVPVQVAANLGATGLEYGATKGAEELGWIPERDDTTANRLNAGLSFFPILGKAISAPINWARGRKFANEALKAKTPQYITAKIGGGMTNAGTQRQLGKVLSSDSEQQFMLRSKIDIGETFDEVTNEMKGKLPVGITRDEFNKNLQRNIGLALEKQRRYASILDVNAANQGATLVDPKQIETALEELKTKYLIIDGAGSHEAGAVAEAIGELQPKLKNINSLTRLSDEIATEQEILRKGGFYDYSPRAKQVLDPSAASAYRTTYNEGLLQVVNTLRSIRQRAIEAATQNPMFLQPIEISGEVLSLPEGFQAMHYANLSDFAHNAIPIKQASEGMMQNVTRGMAATSGSAMRGASEAAPGSFAQAKAGVVSRGLDWLGRQVGVVDQDAAVLKETTEQLNLARKAIDWKRTNPEFQRLSLPEVFNHPMFLQDVASGDTPPTQQDGQSSALRGTLPVVGIYRSIRRNVVDLDNVPDPVKANLFMQVAGPMDGPTLFMQQAGLKQPRDKAKFWSAVAKQFPMFPFGSADTTGLSSEFDDGTGPKLYDDMDKQTWANTIQASPLREDAKAQLTSALFRDGTVYPLQQAGELVQYPMPNPEDQRQSIMMKQIAAARRDVKTKEKVDLING